MTNSLEYKDLGEYQSYKAFVENEGFFCLKETIERFFNCSVVLYPHPVTQLKRLFDLNLLDNPRRGFYPLDEENVVIVARVLNERTLVSAIGFHLKGHGISENVKLLNKFEQVLTGTFTQEFSSFFRNGVLPFGDELIKRIMTKYICHGYYDFRNIRHLIEYFFKLRTTSFEGNYFSTGAIITKAFHDFVDVKSKMRFGQTYDLSNWIRLKHTDIIDKRIWYLADGKKTFFLGTKSLDFTKLFVLDSQYISTNYLDSHSLALTLKGGDALFKVENEKLFSINTSDGIEFLYFENQWKFRNYNSLTKIIMNSISADALVIDSIIFYLLSCSKNQISSILWFPEKLDQIDVLIKTETKNSLINTPINLTDKRFINHIFRCLSSDGATVIDKEGNIRYIGVIVDLSKAVVSGLKGTGETAASALAVNGISIKISQDGNIKIFTAANKDPLIF